MSKASTYSEKIFDISFGNLLEFISNSKITQIKNEIKKRRNNFVGKNKADLVDELYRIMIEDRIYYSRDLDLENCKFEDLKTCLTVIETNRVERYQKTKVIELLKEQKNSDEAKFLINNNNIGKNDNSSNKRLRNFGNEIKNEEISDEKIVNDDNKIYNKKRVKVDNKICTSPNIKDSGQDSNNETKPKKEVKNFNYKVDIHAPPNAKKVHEDYSCMLNQTNITGRNNNNKFYVIQVLEFNDGTFSCFIKYGRVGEAGVTGTTDCGKNLDEAIKLFEKKFRDKTGNKWQDRSNFVSHPKKYELIEMSNESDQEQIDDETWNQILKNKESTGKQSNITYQPSQLCKPTQDLIKMIFNDKMFENTMESFDIDIRKMPLGAISKSQILSGFRVLEEIVELIKNAPSDFHNLIEQKSSEFYTKIPHAFGRRKLQILGDLDVVQKKMDMLNILGDIEIAQNMLKEVNEQKYNNKQKGTEKKIVQNQLDMKYSELNTDLEFLEDCNCDEQKMIDEFSRHAKQKSENYYYAQNFEIDSIQRVNRHDEAERYSVHNKLGNRKLLWHGTNIAVVAAILKSGLRIMPHSGGRVGRGIYFASEASKSLGYIQSAYNKHDNSYYGFIFLNEVALGKEYRIKVDNCNLTSAPKKYDSVIACGRSEPCQKNDRTILIDKKKVVVPIGKPTLVDEYKDSNFYESEYLIYKESQCRIRYLIKLKFS